MNRIKFWRFLTAIPLLISLSGGGALKIRRILLFREVDDALIYAQLDALGVSRSYA